MNGSTRKSKKKFKENMETNENENIMAPNLSEAAKEVPRGKFIAMQAYLKKQEKSQIHNLTLYLKEIEKNKQNPNPAKGNNKDQGRNKGYRNNNKTGELINETRSWFFERINKIDKPLTRLIKKKRERTQIKSQMKEEG